MIQSLKERNFFYFSQIANLELASLWNQELKTNEVLSFQESDVFWESYVGKLKAIHLRISEDEDYLIQSMNVSSVYTLKEGYKISKRIWEFKFPSKPQIFTLLPLNNKALTWYNLQKTKKYDPRRYPLCKECEESDHHIIMYYLYLVVMCKEVEVITRLKKLQNGTSIENELRKQCENAVTKRIRAIPIILTLGTSLQETLISLMIRLFLLYSVLFKSMTL